MIASRSLSEKENRDVTGVGIDPEDRVGAVIGDDEVAVRRQGHEDVNIAERGSDDEDGGFPGRRVDGENGVGVILPTRGRDVNHAVPVRDEAVLQFYLTDARQVLEGIPRRRIP